MQFTPIVPKLELIAHAEVKIGEPQLIGNANFGERRIVPITGGRFEGKLRGEILSGGADWQIVNQNGTAILDARYTLKTSDGVLIYINNRGFRYGAAEVLARIAKGETVDPKEYYFRTAPTFETGDARYGWLNKTIFVCSAIRNKTSVEIDFYEVS